MHTGLSLLRGTGPSLWPIFWIFTLCPAFIFPLRAEQPGKAEIRLLAAAGDTGGHKARERRLQYGDRAASPDSGWSRTGNGKRMGIGGMALIGQSGGGISFLVVHDNKRDSDDRAGIVRRDPAGAVTYSRLDWRGGRLPHDLEALTAVPGRKGEFLAVASGGPLFWIRLAEKEGTVGVLRELQIPGTTSASEIEGFDLAMVENQLVAVWADRGTGPAPARLSWSRFHLDREKPFSEVSHYSLQVPWPEGGDVRDISDLRVDAAGAVFISSAFESEDDALDAEFASAVYLAGVIDAAGTGDVRFRPNGALTRLHRFEGRKVEAVELVPGKDGGIVLATDDEHQGSSVFFSW